MEETLKNKFSSKNILFVVIVILFLLLLAKIKELAILFFASYVIACSLNPIVDKLSQKLNRAISSAIVMGGTIAGVCGIFVPIVKLAAQQVKVFAANLPERIEPIKAYIANNQTAEGVTEGSLDVGNLVSSASGFMSKFLNNSISFSVEFAQTLIYILVACIVIYYLLVDKEVINKTILRLFPSDKRERTSEIIETISNKVGGYVVGQIAAMASVGVVVMVGLAIIKVDCAIILGLLTAALDIVPIVGPLIALVAILLVVFKMGPVAVVSALIVFGVAQLAENYFVRPFVFGKLLNLHPILIYTFLFLSAEFFGVTGVVFSPAIAATVCVLIEELYMKKME